MKPLQSSRLISLPIEEIQHFYTEFYRRKVPRYLFLLLCLNLALAPSVQAATGDVLSRTQAYALGILAMITTALSIYLFVVMFQPERF
jgi:K+-transporting ATPase KdpF subunit